MDKNKESLEESNVFGQDSFEEQSLKKKSNFIYLVISLVNLVGILVLLLSNFNLLKTIKDNEKMINVTKFIKENYYDSSLDDGELEEIMLKGMVDALPDKYSYYLNSDETKKHKEDYQNIKSGLGISVYNSRVVQVYENSPASKAGLQINDLIVSINGIKLLSLEGDKYSEALDKAFSSVDKNGQGEFIIKRDNEQLTYIIKKESYETKLVEYKMLENNIGFLKLNTFSREMYEDFDKAIELFKKENAKGLIIDIRYNLGGEKQAVEYIADALMKDVLIGTMVYGGDYEDELMETDSDALELPMVLLINELTASCSEILAGSIVANKKGITIGKNTYGKGTALGVVEFKDGTSVGISMGEIVLSNGEKLEGIGVKPYIEEEDESKHLGLAIEYLNSLDEKK